MRILIDGYNMLRTSPNFSRLNKDKDVETMRNELNQLLRAYKKVKGHEITIVYDSATGGLFGKQESYKSAGIKEIFTAKGESADDVIKRIAIKNPQGLVVVTADSDVAVICAKAGATVISPWEFEEKIFFARYWLSKGINEIDEEDIIPYSTQNRGPSRKLSKKQRKDMRLKNRL